MCVLFGLTISVDAKEEKESDLKKQLVCAKTGSYFDSIPNIIIPDSVTFEDKKGTYYYIGYTWGYLFRNEVPIIDEYSSFFKELVIGYYQIKRLYYIYAWKFNENTTFFVARRWDGKKWNNYIMTENPYKERYHYHIKNNNNGPFYYCYHDNKVKYQYMILDNILNKYYPFINF